MVKNLHITKIASAFIARWKILLGITGILLLSLLFACTPDVEGTPNTEGGPGPTVDTYTVGGSISGHTGDVTLTLKYDDEIETLSVPLGTKNFTFSSRLTDGPIYVVSVTYPQGQTCRPGAIFGKIYFNQNVTNLNIICSASTYAVSGSVRGLAEGETITLTFAPTGGTAETKDITGDDRTLAQDNFSFATKLEKNTTYSVVVTTQPDGKTCTVAPAGQQTMGESHTTITVICTQD